MRYNSCGNTIDWQDVEDNEVTSEALIYIDTAGCELFELDLPDEQSKGNEGLLTLRRFCLYLTSRSVYFAKELLFFFNSRSICFY